MRKDTKIEYEIFLRFGDDDDFYVDVREDEVDADGVIVNGGEYVEGFIFDTYKEALVKYHESIKKYNRKAVTEVGIKTPSPTITVNCWDEVKEYAEGILNAQPTLNP